MHKNTKLSKEEKANVFTRLEASMKRAWAAYRGLVRAEEKQNNLDIMKSLDKLIRSAYEVAEFGERIEGDLEAKRGCCEPIPAEGEY